MTWENLYQERVTTAEAALMNIRDNQRVVIGHACAEPGYLVDEMIRLKEHFHNIEIVHMVPMGKCEYCQPEMIGHFRHNALFAGGPTRNAVAAGYADFTPVYFSEVPKLFEKYLPVDVALIMVTPPDKNGKVSLGLSVDYTKAAVEMAKLVIAQVNDQMPYTFGDGVLDVSEIDLFVEHSAPMLELKAPVIGEVEKKIGQNCASLIHDGDTLQLGIGAIPDAVLSSLKDKKNLGIHSEMFSDGVVDLVEAGIINNSKKALNPGKMVATFLMGTKKLYDFVDKNPDVLMCSVDYTNNPVIVAQNNNLVCINSCVQIDLTGQVASESVGYKQISGVGGQVDFVRGAAMSKDGIAIIAMPSTAAKGTSSKIVPLLNEGAAVTTNRTDVDYVITEYGIAQLKGKTLRQRAFALIKIAHPNFRDELIVEYEKRFN